jgi:N12 class adenine-specific DNA methylase
MGNNRATALELIQDALNLKTPTIYDKVRVSGKADKQVVNAEATEGARESSRKSKTVSRNGFGRTTSGANGSSKNTTRNSTAVRLRDVQRRPSDVAGRQPDHQLHPHQKAGVWRILQTPNTLLGHVVGAGKTYTMVAAGWN